MMYRQKMVAAVFLTLQANTETSSYLDEAGVQVFCEDGCIDDANALNLISNIHGNYPDLVVASSKPVL